MYLEGEELRFEPHKKIVVIYFVFQLCVILFFMYKLNALFNVLIFYLYIYKKKYAIFHCV